MDASSSSSFLLPCQKPTLLSALCGFPEHSGSVVFALTAAFGQLLELQGFTERELKTQDLLEIMIMPPLVYRHGLVLMCKWKKEGQRKEREMMQFLAGIQASSEMILYLLCNTQRAWYKFKIHDDNNPILEPDILVWSLKMFVPRTVKIPGD